MKFTRKSPWQHRPWWPITVEAIHRDGVPSTVDRMLDAQMPVRGLWNGERADLMVRSGQWSLNTPSARTTQ